MTTREARVSPCTTSARPKHSRTEVGDGRDPSVPVGTSERIDIAAFRQGDGFETFLVHYGSLIHSVAHTYAIDGDEQEDLYQKTCIRIFERRASFSGAGSLASWINRIAHSTCLNAGRARANRRAATDRYSANKASAISSHGGRTDPWEHTVAVDVRAKLRRALAKLGERQASAFVLTQVEGYSASEAAGIMGLAESTVRSNLRHARRRLRELLEVTNELSES